MAKLHFLFLEKCSRFIRIASIITMIFYISALTAQDTIVKRNDEKIAVKILEVNLTDIKYKLSNYENGPTFTIFKWELKYIVFGNGVKETFEGLTPPTSVKNDLMIQPAGKFYYYKNQKITEQNMLDIVWKRQNKKINPMIIKTEKIRIVNNCFFVGGMALGAVGILEFTGILRALNALTSASTTGITQTKAQRIAQRRATLANRHRVGGGLILGALSCELTHVVFNIKERKLSHMVVDLYNESLLP